MATIKYDRVNKSNAEKIFAAMQRINEGAGINFDKADLMPLIQKWYFNRYVLFDAKCDVIAVVTITQYENFCLFETAWLKKLSVDEREKIMRDFETQYKSSVCNKAVWWSGCC